ncbi:MAG TPA: hypothetical protein VFI13_12620 [Gemmatimonadales bacterium]|nr:hypothetical protein [Gemmatimonadales bacterium]
MKRLLTALLLLLPAVARAQRHCVDTLAGASWRRTPLMASVTAPAPGDRDRDRYAAAIVQALPQGYIDPGADAMPAGAMGIVPPPDQRTPIHASLELALDRHGRVLDGHIITSSGRPDLDLALLQAVKIVGGPNGLGKMPRKLRGDTVRFTIAVDDRDAPRGAGPLGALSSAHLEADHAPVLRSMPRARAPRGHHGRVVLAGTVDAKGKVVPATIRVVSATDSALVSAARASFARALFRPGTRHDCPAEATIRQVFPFR